MLFQSDDGHELLVGTLFLGGRLGAKMSFAKFVLAVLVCLHIQRAINLAVGVGIHPAFWQNDENAIVACFVFDSLGTLKAKDVETDINGVVWHVCLVVSYLIQRRFS